MPPSARSATATVTCTGFPTAWRAGARPDSPPRAPRHYCPSSLERDVRSVATGRALAGDRREDISPEEKRQAEIERIANRVGRGETDERDSGRIAVEEAVGVGDTELDIDARRIHTRDRRHQAKCCRRTVKA